MYKFFVGSDKAMLFVTPHNFSVTVGAVAETPRDMRSPKGNGVPLFTECP